MDTAGGSVVVIRDESGAVVDQRVFQDTCVMSSAQVGKTEIINNVVGFHIEHDPCPILLLQPTLEMSETWSKDRLAPMLRDTPSLKGKVRDPRSRDSNNTLRHKTFPGGHITMAGANSPASLASRPVRLVLCDEVDRYPPSAGSEGDPVSLAHKRSTTFWNRGRLLTSTPTVKGVSRIEAAYEESTQDRYYVPCHACGEFQTLKWAQVKWEPRQPETAKYECEHCQAHWSDAQRWNALKDGEWRSEKPAARVRGFHLNEIYSPWTVLEDMVASWMEAKKRPETLRTFINTALGETWEEEGTMEVNAETLADRLRKPYPSEIPMGAVVLTAFVDVQRDRLECEVVGWGAGYESWSIDYRVIEGDTSRDQVWGDLDEHIARKWMHESGKEFGIAAVGVDSGDQTQHVYKWVKPRESQRVWAFKGMGGQGRPLIVNRTRRNQQKVLLFTIGVDGLKSTLYARLRLEEPGPGYCHFPIDRPDDYFEQLTSERARTKWTRGQPAIEWILPQGRRNEALDCRVGNMAVVEILKPNFKVLTEKLAPAEKQDEQKPERPAVKRRRSNWVGRSTGGYVNNW